MKLILKILTNGNAAGDIPLKILTNGNAAGDIPLKQWHHKG